MRTKRTWSPAVSTRTLWTGVDEVGNLAEKLHRDCERRVNDGNPSTAAPGPPPRGPTPPAHANRRVDLRRRRLSTGSTARMTMTRTQMTGDAPTTRVSSDPTTGAGRAGGRLPPTRPDSRCRGPRPFLACLWCHL